MNRLPLALLILLLALGAGGCTRAQDPTAPPAHEPMPSNRIDINPAVRQNLGITFAKVERRPVGRTLRVPGRFELLPTARREYRAPASGRVDLLVEQFQRVEPGTPLYRLDAPRWRELQRELTDAEASLQLARAGAASIGPFMEAHQRHHTEIESAVELWTQRVTALEGLQAAGGARGEEVSAARASLASARAELAETMEKEAELAARERQVRAELVAATSRVEILLEAAASLTGISAEELAAVHGDTPRWRALPALEIRALSAGVVDAIETVSGSFVEQHGTVITTVEPDRVRFRARALQSDLGRLTDGLAATVVPPQGGSLDGRQHIRGTLTLAPTADPERRTIGIVMTPSGEGPPPAWARAGVSAFLEIVVQGGGGEELAVPLASVVRDGTQSIIFRRDPADPNKAIRMEADLGIDDGRWIVVKSGVGEGNEVVLDGAYQLMVATSGSITKGGHFHPDGTFHEGDH